MQFNNIIQNKRKHKEKIKKLYKDKNELARMSMNTLNKFKQSKQS